MLLFNDCLLLLLLLFISLSTQSGNFWIHPRTVRSAVFPLSLYEQELQFAVSSSDVSAKEWWREAAWFLANNTQHT